MNQEAVASDGGTLASVAEGEEEPSEPAGSGIGSIWEGDNFILTSAAFRNNSLELYSYIRNRQVNYKVLATICNSLLIISIPASQY